jgi:hypothetical protein
MAKFRRPSPKPLGLDPTESAALRDISNHGAPRPDVLARLKKLGLVEQKAGVWTTTHQGQIQLIFGSAR